MKRIKAEPKEPELEETDDQTVSGLIIHITPDWRLAYDGYQFIIQERRIRKEGKKAGIPYWNNKAYVAHLDGAILWLARKRIYMIPGTYGPETLEHLCATLDQIKEECTTACKNAVDRLAKAQAGDATI